MDLRRQDKELRLSLEVKGSRVVIGSGDDSIEVEGVKNPLGELREFARAICRVTGDKLASDLTQEEARRIYCETSW